MASLSAKRLRNTAWTMAAPCALRYDETKERMIIRWRTAVKALMRLHTAVLKALSIKNAELAKNEMMSALEDTWPAFTDSGFINLPPLPRRPLAETTLEALVSTAAACMKTILSQTTSGI